MKKILSTLLWIFLVFSFSIVNLNIVNAQAMRGGNQAQKQAEQSEDVGIHFNENCLTWMWVWCFHYERVIWIDDNQPGSGYTATSIAQDLVVSATYAVWTILTLAIIYCWLRYIFASASGKSANEYWKRLVRAAIWACLVRWAYGIVRLIQYIARW